MQDTEPRADDEDLRRQGIDPTIGGMRFGCVLVLVLLASPALAQGWERYVDARLGFTIEVPPGYRDIGDVPDGRAFARADGRSMVIVRGGEIAATAGFENAAIRLMDQHRDAGWILDAERLTPRWASYAGRRNGQILNVRIIAACAGTRYAAFELHYPERDIAAMRAVGDGLAASLGAGSTGCPDRT